MSGLFEASKSKIEILRIKLSKNQLMGYDPLCREKRDWCTSNGFELRYNPNNNSYYLKTPK
jgi:hypothetical protein